MKKAIPRLAGMTFVALTAATLSVAVSALGSGQSFLTLSSGYEQELFAARALPADSSGLPIIFGGIAFAPNGDPWVSECLFFGATLHRFDHAGLVAPIHGTSTLRPQIAEVPIPGGCGLTNNPDGFLYSNSTDGVYRLNAETGAQELWMGTSSAHGAPGNALGITTDPITNHIVYPGADCHPTLQPDAETCTLWDLDPDTAVATMFAQVPHDVMPFADGVYFDPTGEFLFVANRTEDGGRNFLSIVSRPASPVTGPSTDQIVQSLLMASEPDGVAFHDGSPRFVVTNDESHGTMTRFDFPGDDYTQPPLQYVDAPFPTPSDPPERVYGETFASGAFRGDLTQVGPDGCIYATQSWGDVGPDPQGDPNHLFQGTRYDDGTRTAETSVVRVCAVGGGGFVPPPGVRTNATGHLTLIKTVVNDNGGHAAATDFTLSASGPTPIAGAGGVSQDVNAGSYTLSETTLPGYVAGGWSCAGGSLTGNTVAIASGQSVTCSIVNDDQPAHLALVKTVINAHGGGAAPAAFTLSAAGPTPISGAGGVSRDVNPGTYVLSETTLPGYMPGAWSCAGGVQSGNTVGLAAGQSATCTITNNDIPPGLAIVKNVDLSTIVPFQQVTYSYTVTNTGAATLANVVVTDDNGTPGYAADDFVVGTIPSLAAGASVTLAAQVIPVVSTEGTVNGNPVDAGAIIVVVPQANGDIRVTYIQDFGINDNTYGTGAIGWSGGHTFGNLTGSDKLEFRFFDKNGAVVLDFYQDYISSSTLFPSGYGSLCASGGDGFMVAGNVTNIVSCSTSLTDNLNRPANLPNKAALIVNSPTSLVGGSVVVDPVKAPGGWDQINRYTAVIKASTFGTAGFGSVTVPDQHNSPSKLGVNQIATTPKSSSVTNTASAVTASAGGLSATATATVHIALPPAGGGGCTVAVTAEKLDKKEVQITLANNGSADLVLSGLTLTWPIANGNLMKVTLDGDVVYDHPDIAAPTANLAASQMVADPKKRTIAKATSDVLHLLFQNNVDKVASKYSNGMLTFGGSCTIAIP